MPKVEERPCFVLILKGIVAIVKHEKEYELINDVIGNDPERIYWCRENEIIRLEVDKLKWNLLRAKGEMPNFQFRFYLDSMRA